MRTTDNDFSAFHHFSETLVANEIQSREQEKAGGTRDGHVEGISAESAMFLATLGLLVVTGIDKFRINK